MRVRIGCQWFQSNVRFIQKLSESYGGVRVALPDDISLQCSKHLRRSLYDYWVYADGQEVQALFAKFIADDGNEDTFGFLVELSQAEFDTYTRLAH